MTCKANSRPVIVVCPICGPEALKDLAHEADDFDYGDESPELVAAIVRARAAIAQAEGEAA